MKKKAFSKITRCWAAALFLIFIIALVIIAAVRLSDYFRADAAVAAHGRQSLDFRVFYVENSFFPENPMPRNLDFLMSYTDYIEIDSKFDATFSEEMNIHYSYRAEKRFVIRHMGAVYNYLNNIVFEEVHTLSETGGAVTSNELSFGVQVSGGPGGTYTIFPKEHIELYFEFVEDQARQMAAENVIAPGLRGFSADLMINFTYTISAPEFGLNETLTYGYRIPLTTEIYRLTTIGAPAFEWSDNLQMQDSGITLPLVILFTVLFALNVFGLLYTVRALTSDSNKYRREADSILKKYSHEIVVYDKPVDMTRHESMVVQEFGELLKLAINLNKHIMCYRNRTYTEFVVIVDEFACLYVINYDRDSVEKKRESTPVL